VAQAQQALAEAQRGLESAEETSAQAQANLSTRPAKHVPPVRIGPRPAPIQALTTRPKTARARGTLLSPGPLAVRPFLDTYPASGYPNRALVAGWAARLPCRLCHTSGNQ
jgi:hypothetical protein